ncbi:MAG: carboxypeptidase M32 [Candidatus Amoebophilus sp. 36-38]|nr:MAG: carboxypeptidase M32 [Candidatus Amoebophilus sp. 36-38]
MAKQITQYLKLENKLKQLTHLRNLASVLHWDAEINLPKGATANRHEELATLTMLTHEMSTSQELGNLIEAATQEIGYLDEWQKSNLATIKRSYEHAQCINPDLQHAYSIATSECEFVWREARKKNDFTQLIPHLDHVFKLSRKIADLKASHFNKDPYDMLMDGYDPDRSTTEIQGVYDILKRELPKLIEKITAKQQAEKIINLPDKIDENIQKTIGLRLIEKMGFDMDKGRLDKSAHPFCSGSNDDVRLTTRYDENNFITGLFGIIHETGHGLYQQNLPESYRNQPVGQPKGMAFHESQSLIMECQAGTSFEFIQFLARLLRDEFGFKGPAYSAENLYKLVNRVQPSLIRVEADEVTYPLHVIIRFEIEQAIIKDRVQATDLPHLWNTKMKEYLGITPTNDSEGCMQDVHWPAGLLGYFPCYTNGAIIASMLMKAAQIKYPAIKTELREGSFESLNTYLNQNLRNFGAQKSSSELLKTSTGYEKINPGIFLDYLAGKYL